MNESSNLNIQKHFGLDFNEEIFENFLAVRLHYSSQNQRKCRINLHNKGIPRFLGKESSHIKAKVKDIKSKIFNPNFSLFSLKNQILYKS